MIPKWLHHLRQMFFRDQLPYMIWGFRGADKIYRKHVRISNTTHIGNKEKLILGDDVFIGHFNMIDASNGLTIEEGCQLTNYISVLTHSSHLSIRLYGKAYTKQRDHKGYLRGPVVIGKYSFIGPHSVIMPGTKIGKGSIVSAFSYVKGEFPDFAVLSGNPATVTGDTREMDQPFLDQHPDLMELYNQWSK